MSRYENKKVINILFGENKRERYILIIRIASLLVIGSIFTFFISEKIDSFVGINISGYLLIVSMMISEYLILRKTRK